MVNRLAPNPGGISRRWKVYCEDFSVMKLEMQFEKHGAEYLPDVPTDGSAKVIRLGTGSYSVAFNE